MKIQLRAGCHASPALNTVMFVNVAVSAGEFTAYFNNMVLALRHFSFSFSCRKLVVFGLGLWKLEKRKGLGGEGGTTYRKVE